MRAAHPARVPEARCYIDGIMAVPDALPLRLNFGTLFVSRDERAVFQTSSLGGSRAGVAASRWSNKPPFPALAKALTDYSDVFRLAIGQLEVERLV